MNYQKIYDDFIADRINKQPNENFEIHHILPKCMGGRDNKENLIRLSYRDHVFAHQLLARVYNMTKYHSEMWGAVIALLKAMGKRVRKLTKTDVYRFELAKNAARLKNTGADSLHSDKNIYTFKNANGTIFCGTRFQFFEKHGVASTKVTRIIEEDGRKTSCGWTFVSAVCPITGKDKSIDRISLEGSYKKFWFINRTGWQVKTTFRDFVRYSKITWDEALELKKTGIIEKRGWALL